MPPFCLSSLVILALLVLYKSEFLDNYFVMNQMWQSDYLERSPVIQMYSMCQVASVCRGLARNENLESLQVDWKRETISHCNSVPLLDINSLESFVEFI